MLPRNPNTVFSLLVIAVALLFATGCTEQQHATGENAPSDSSDEAKADSASDEERVRVVRVPNGGSVPDAEVDDDGVVHLVYLFEGDIYYVSSSDNGQNFGEPVRVNSEAGFAAGAAFRGPDVAVGGNGRVHVVWYNAAYQQKRPTDEWGVMYSRLALDGSAFEAARNLNHTPSDNYSLAADQSGRVAVVWMADGVFANVSRDNGDSFSAPIDLKTDPCECCGSRAVLSNEETLYVLYRDKVDNDRDTYLALLPANGQQFTHSKVSQTVWHIDSCPMTGSFLSNTNDGLVAAWETKTEIYFTRLDRSGQRVSKQEIHVADRGRYPVVLTATDGVTVAAWKNGASLEWQLFDADDAPLRERGTSAANAPDRPAGVVLKDGTFLLFP